jgi:hypothetical protein
LDSEIEETWVHSGSRSSSFAGYRTTSGFDRVEARARARLTLAYLEGDHVIFVREAPAERRRFLRLRHRLLTAR